VSKEKLIKILRDTPMLNGIYSDYFAKYKIMNCKLKRFLNILKPEYVNWVSTYKCNFRCEHCEASAGDKEEILELDTKEACELMAELGDMKVKRIFIGGGEPLLRKDLFVIIDSILDAGMEYGISSNSYLFSRFKEQFSKAPPSWMYFTSIDGLEKTNDKIRMTGSFNMCIEALEFFKYIGVERRKVNTVVTPGNIGELSELKKIILNSDANSWRFSLVIPSGRAKNNSDMYLSDEQIMYLFNFVEDTRKEFDVEISEDSGYLGCLSLKLREAPFFCGAGFTRCDVMPDGEVFGCSMGYDNRYSEGNIRNVSFKETWKKGFSHFRDPQLNKECLDCKYIGPCRGGCCGMRLENMHCLKRIWEKMETRN